jgi:hypothetical protein
VGFKSDREFLRNVSIGAVGTHRVAEILRAGGFQIIELERQSSSNKIWLTKIKRLRVPDLLCLRTGIRIESRGKTSLEITMSHALKNPDRAWDKGLRDDDLVAFVKCTSVDDVWRASDRVVLFRTGDMRAQQHRAIPSQMKSAEEGNEISLTWPATVPKAPGTVSSVTTGRIETALSTGRKQSYQLTREGKDPLTAHVTVGDSFGAGDTVIASAMPGLISARAPARPQYDFLRDLKSTQREDIYVAVKALGFLPDLKSRSIKLLIGILLTHEDPRIRLEAAASLARLDDDRGWDHLKVISSDADADLEFRMEAAFILAELPSDRAIELLSRIVATSSNAPELRAAGVWGLAGIKGTLDTILAFASDPDETTAVHSIVGAARLIDSANIAQVLNRVADDDRESAGIVRAVLASKTDFVREALGQLQAAPVGRRRQWLLYLLAAAGEERCASTLHEFAPELRNELDFFWTHQAHNWTNRLDVADQINYLEQQS